MRKICKKFVEFVEVCKLMYVWAMKASKITNIWPILFTVLKLIRGTTAIYIYVI
jgi:hypothetical protein